MTMKIHLGPSGETYSYVLTTHMINVNKCCFSVAYLGPSVTPLQDNNPAYRIYELNNDATFQLVDYHEYFFDLARANNGNIYNDPNWQYLYGAKVSSRDHVIQCMTSLTLGSIWVEEPTA